MTDKFKHFNEFDNHIIIYSKSGWYKHTDTMEDIKTLISKISGTDIKYIQDIDVVQMVSSTMHKVLSVKGTPTYGDMDFLYKDIWRDPDTFFETRKTITMCDMVESHLRVIHLKDITNYPKLTLPRADYLPLKSNDTLERWHDQHASWDENIKKLQK